jgi:enterobacterial common antigen flippase
LEPQTSYKQILKTTGLVGISQVILIISRIIRTKLIAVFLGPAGTGLFGMYQSTTDLVGSISGLGLNFSAVRDVAAAHATQDEIRIRKTIKILRTWVWFSGIFGMMVVIIFSKKLSIYTFGNDKETLNICLLSLTLLFIALSGGQLALLQGMREIPVLTKANVFGSVTGLLTVIPLLWIYREKAVVPSIILASAGSLALSFYYSRRFRFKPIKLPYKEIFTGGLGMVKLGFFTVISGFAATGSMYIVRVIVLRNSDINIVGQYLAAWTISSMYAGMIMTAMSSDYFPRISAASNDHINLNRLVNEQTLITILVSAPVIIAMLIFLPAFVLLLYSSKYAESIPILYWQLFGTYIKVVVWSIGFILLAKGKGILFVTTEILWNIFYILIVYLGWKYFGVEITGIAFLISYCIYFIAVLIIIKPLCGFKYDKKNIKLSMFFLLLVITAFLNSELVITPFRYFTGSAILIISMFIAYRELDKIINIKKILIRYGVCRERLS